MKVKLIKVSPPFCRFIQKNYAEPGVGGNYSYLSTPAVVITFWGIPEDSLQIKQFFCCAASHYTKVGVYKTSLCFSTLMLAEAGDELYVLPWRYPGDEDNAEGLGSQVIDIRNLSRPERTASVQMQAYEDQWDMVEEK